MDTALAHPDMPPPSFLQLPCTYPQLLCALFLNACTHSLLQGFSLGHWDCPFSMESWKCLEVTPGWPMTNKRWVQEYERKGLLPQGGTYSEAYFCSRAPHNIMLRPGLPLKWSPYLASSPSLACSHHSFAILSWDPSLGFPCTKPTSQSLLLGNPN